MLHKEFWGMLFLAFVAWVFISGTPQERINNVCRPIGWTGNVIVSMSALVLPDHQARMQGYFDKLEYGCRYMTWRLFYQEAYNAYKAQQAAAARQATTPATPASPAAPAEPAAPSAPPVPTAPASAPLSN